MQRFAQSLFVMTAGLMLAAVTMGQAAGGAAAAPPPTKLAVVNVVRLFDSLDEKGDADLSIKNMQKSYNDEIAKRKKEIESLTAELESNIPTFKPGSPESRKMEDDLLQKTADLDAYTRISQQKLFMEMRAKTAMLYEKMNQAVAAYAQANGIALVFSADDMTMKDARSPEQLQAMITLKKLVYYNPMFDITKSIQAKMNSDYKLGANAQR